MSDALAAALSAIPLSLRNPLLQEFDGLLTEYRAGRWELVGLKAGKLCEVVYSVLHGHTQGSFAAAPFKPSNMVAACQALEQAGAGFSRSVRIQMPRLIIALYELRNNRAIGHVGGEVDPNHMDAELFLRGAKWLIAELVRVFGNTGTDAAHVLIEQVTEKVMPVVWEVGNAKKVLNPNLSTGNKALVLAYSTPDGVTAKTLCEWIGYSNLSRFRSMILKKLDEDALIHYTAANDTIVVTPTGVRLVETSGLLTMK
ncbi:MAG TPA: hypothetical protein VFF65_01745 [Phycisphaerales bacterium]|nr:hypothetical protein [Phycisphaerales bacterium]